MRAMPFDEVDARSLRSHYAGLAVDVGGVIGELAGGLTPGATWIVAGPSYERVLLLDRLAAVSARSELGVAVASTERAPYEVGLAVVEAGARSSTFHALGAGDDIARLLDDPVSILGRPPSVIVVDGADDERASGDRWLRSWRRFARDRRCAVVVGVPHAEPDEVRRGMLVTDVLLRLGRVDLRSLEVDLTVDRPGVPTASSSVIFGPRGHVARA